MFLIPRVIRIINEIVASVDECDIFHHGERRISDIILTYLFDGLRLSLFSLLRGDYMSGILIFYLLHGYDLCLQLVPTY